MHSARNVSLLLWWCNAASVSSHRRTMDSDFYCMCSSATANRLSVCCLAYMTNTVVQWQQQCPKCSHESFIVDWLSCDLLGVPSKIYAQCLDLNAKLNSLFTSSLPKSCLDDDDFVLKWNRQLWVWPLKNAGKNATVSLSALQSFCNFLQLNKWFSKVVFICTAPPQCPRPKKSIICLSLPLLLQKAVRCNWCKLPWQLSAAFYPVCHWLYAVFITACMEMKKWFFLDYHFDVD